MSKEFEYAFLNFNKKTIVSTLKKYDGKYIGTYLFRVQVLSHPLKREMTYVRVRDEGIKNTMTFKYRNSKKDEFPIEHEVVIDNFNEMVNILIGLGCEKMHYYEKTREIWNIGKTEFVFDNYPMLPEIMEIESDTKNNLLKLVKLFGLNVDDKNEIKNTTVEKLYGFNYQSGVDTTFQNIKKYKKLVKKNKKLFKKIISEQLVTYEKIIKIQYH